MITAELKQEILNDSEVKALMERLDAVGASVHLLVDAAMELLISQIKNPGYRAGVRFVVDYLKARLKEHEPKQEPKGWFGKALKWLHGFLGSN